MLEILLIIVVVGLTTAIYIYNDKEYKKTTYYKITQNSYSHIKYDKGKYGEYIIYKCLRHLEEEGGKFLFNLYIPKNSRGTSEIDVLLICAKGLFVFESKNYSGWIFGNEAHKTWTQTFPQGRGRSRKEYFYNPIMQNSSHIRHLKYLVGNEVPIRSVITFSNACTLRNVTIRSKDVCVTNHRYLAASISRIFQEENSIYLTPIQINNLYNRLYLYSQVGSETKEQHANSLQNY